jgi:hypothetical protein
VPTSLRVVYATGTGGGIDIGRMIKRRLKPLGLPDEFSPPLFWATTVIDLLDQGTPLEDVQYLAGARWPACLP